MPGTLQAGATEQFCLTLHGITKTQTITVSFSLKYDKTGSFDTRNMTFTFNNGKFIEEVCVIFFLFTQMIETVK